MSDVMRDITNAMETEIQAELGVLYKKLAYVEDVSKNSLRTSSDRYGVRALESSQIPGVTKFTTYTQSYEVVLSKGYVQSNIDDTEQVDASYDLRALLLDIYTRLVQTHAGLPLVVLNIFNMVADQPEYLVDEKVVVIRATMDITYRLTLL